MPETRGVTTTEAVTALTEQVKMLQEQFSQLSNRMGDSSQSGSGESSELKAVLPTVFPSINPSAATLISVFSGKSSEDVTIFIQDVLAAANLCNWSEQTTLQMAKLRLSGEAKTYVMYHVTLSKVATFTQLADGLRLRYRKQNSARFFREKLSTLKQMSNETVESFTDRIRKLNIQTYELTGNPDADTVLIREAEDRALDVFLRGITPEFSRRVRMENPKSVEEALRVATHLQEIDAVTKPQSEKRLFASNKECFRCGKKGHMKAQCRQPKCFNCQRFGHKKRECRSKKQGGNTKGSETLNKKGALPAVEESSQ